MIPGHRSLEADDVLLRSFPRRHIFPGTRGCGGEGSGDHARKPRGMQDILDDLFHPFAVSLLREGLFRSLDDGCDLFGHPFLLNGRHGSRSPVT